jgi:hypothetical protein
MNARNEVNEHVITIGSRSSYQTRGVQCVESEPLRNWHTETTSHCTAVRNNFNSGPLVVCDNITTAFNCVKTSVKTCIFRQVQLETFRSRNMRLAVHVARRGRRGTRIGYWQESQRERDRWEDKDMWVDNIRMDLGEVG